MEPTPESLTYALQNIVNPRSRTPILRCAVCNTEPAILCPSCKSTAYCNATCRGVDRPCHELVCASFANLPPRPASTTISGDVQFYKLGLFFPPDAPAPQPVWVKYCVTGRDVLADVRSYILNTYDCHIIRHNAVPLGGHAPFALERKLELFFDDEFKINNAPINSAAYAASDSASGDVWRGPLLVIADYQPRGFYLSERTLAVDVYAADLRAVADCFADVRRLMEEGQQMRQATRAWKGGPVRTLTPYRLPHWRDIGVLHLPISPSVPLEKDINVFLPELPPLERANIDAMLRDTAVPYQPLLPQPASENVQPLGLGQMALSAYLSDRDKNANVLPAQLTVFGSTGDRVRLVFYDFSRLRHRKEPTQSETVHGQNRYTQSTSYSARAESGTAKVRGEKTQSGSKVGMFLKRIFGIFGKRNQ